MSARPEHDRRGALLLAGAVLLLFAFQLHAFHWGVITPDTVEQYGEALSGDYQDWHPPIMAWIWRQLGGARFGSAPLLILDCALYWTGFHAIAEALRRRGQPGWAAGAVMLGALPIPFGEIGSILKDAMLTGCLGAAAGLLAFDPLQGRRIAPWRRIGAAALAILASAVRINGIFAAAPLLLLAAAPGIWRRPRLGLAGLIAAGLALIASGALLNDAMLHPKHSHPLYSVYTFDLAGISAGSGRVVYPAPAPDLATVRSCYTPAQYNPRNTDPCTGIEDRFFAAALHGPQGATSLWLDAVRAEPGAYLLHRARHFNAAMRWWEARVPDDAIYLMSQPNTLGLSFTPTPASRAIYHAATWLAWSPLGRPATWLAAALGLLIVAPWLRCGRLVGTLAASSLLYGGAYAIAGVAPDLRYNDWTMLAAMLALLLALADPARAAPGRRRWMVAALPPLLAIAGEMAAILIG